MSMISVCGADCAACYCYGSMCNGCNEAEGKVFHVPEGKACTIYECTVNTNKLAYWSHIKSQVAALLS